MSFLIGLRSQGTLTNWSNGTLKFTLSQNMAFIFGCFEFVRVTGHFDPFCFFRTSLFHTHTHMSLPQLSFPRPNEGHHCEEISQLDDTVHTTPWDIHDDPASHSESWLLISQTTEDPEVLPTSRVTVACQTTASPQPLYEKPRPNLEKNRLLHRTEKRYHHLRSNRNPNYPDFIMVDYKPQNSTALHHHSPQSVFQNHASSHIP